MNRIDEDITWVLTDFKSGKLNFYETLVRIKRIFAHSIGATIIEDLPNELNSKD